MPVVKQSEVHAENFRNGASRIIVHTEKLMVVVIDFFNGPWNEPDPFHQHAHEQISYVASGEVLFLCDGEEDVKLQAGDLFSVPSNKLHAIKLLSDKARLVDSFSPVREDLL